MDDELTFNTNKLQETIDVIRKNYLEYKDSIESLEKEIKSLEEKWGANSNSAYKDFREKYDEKRQKLLDAEKMMKELLDTLENKNEELYTATENTINTFE